MPVDLQKQRASRNPYAAPPLPGAPAPLPTSMPARQNSASRVYLDAMAMSASRMWILVAITGGITLFALMFLPGMIGLGHVWGIDATGKAQSVISAMILLLVGGALTAIVIQQRNAHGFFPERHMQEPAKRTLATIRIAMMRRAGFEGFSLASLAAAALLQLLCGGLALAIGSWIFAYGYYYGSPWSYAMCWRPLARGGRIVAYFKAFLDLAGEVRSGRITERDVRIAESGAVPGESDAVWIADRFDGQITILRRLKGQLTAQQAMPDSQNLPLPGGLLSRWSIVPLAELRTIDKVLHRRAMADGFTHAILTSGAPLPGQCERGFTLLAMGQAAVTLEAWSRANAALPGARATAPGASLLS